MITLSHFAAVINKHLDALDIPFQTDPQESDEEILRRSLHVLEDFKLVPPDLFVAVFANWSNEEIHTGIFVNFADAVLWLIGQAQEFNPEIKTMDEDWDLSINYMIDIQAVEISLPQKSLLRVGG